MPTYMYKAATKSGLVVRNKVEASSKQSLIKALKRNDLLPIDVEQLTYRTNKKKTKKKNITDKNPSKIILPAVILILLCCRL